MRKLQSRTYLTGNVRIVYILKLRQLTLITSLKTFNHFSNIYPVALSNKAKFEANGSLDNSAICESTEQTATASSSEKNGESREFGSAKTTFNNHHSSDVREESTFEESKKQASLDLVHSELDKPCGDLFSTTASDDHETSAADFAETSSNDTSPDVSSNQSPFPMMRSSSLDHDNGSISFDTGLISVESDDTLYDAISVLKTFGFHRVLVMDYSDNDPLFILTYKRILYFIYVMVSCRGTLILIVLRLSSNYM